MGDKFYMYISMKVINKLEFCMESNVDLGFRFEGGLELLSLPVDETR